MPERSALIMPWDDSGSKLDTASPTGSSPVDGLHGAFVEIRLPRQGYVLGRVTGLETHMEVVVLAQRVVHGEGDVVELAAVLGVGLGGGLEEV